MLADTEFSDFRKWFYDHESVSASTFEDPLFKRCVHARRTGSHRDFMILIRQALRRHEIQNNIEAELIPFNVNDLEMINQVKDDLGFTVIEQDGYFISANAWRPEWLGEIPSNLSPDIASVAGCTKGERAMWRDEMRSRYPADPFFAEIPTSGVPYDEYRTVGQRNAVRAAVSMPEDGTLIAVLPTGSGKTQIAEAVAMQCQKYSVSKRSVVLVVPTVALAFDLDSRFRDNYSQILPPHVLDRPWSWTGGMDDDDKSWLAQGLKTGNLPMLITSPESLTNNSELTGALKDAVNAGNLGALVIDEAHLFTQWGMFFRPPYREVSRLRRTLLDLADEAEARKFKTICMTATLGTFELEDLYKEFKQDDKTSFVVDNFIRPEPDIWIAPAKTNDQRTRWVLESVDRLPRPLFLYTTQVKDVEKWKRLLTGRGYQRIEVVHGKTSNSQRKEVLEKLKSRGVQGVDIVIATSAFGLGIDCDEVRSVVHACIPETVDRYYQEVGRAGRDGYVSTALMLPLISSRGDIKDDISKASSNSTSGLKPETAFKRWTALWEQRPHSFHDGSFVVDIETTPDHLTSSQHDTPWNQVVLQGLASKQLGIIDREYIKRSKLREIGVIVDDENQGEKRQTSDFELVKFKSDNKLMNLSWWEENWPKYNDGLVEESSGSLNLMKKIIQFKTPLCSALRDTYLAPDDLIDEYPELRNLEIQGRCGRCPLCRAGEYPPNNHSLLHSAKWVVAEPSMEVWSNFELIREEIFQHADKPMVVRIPPADVGSNEIETKLEELYNRLAKLGVLWFGGDIPRGFQSNRVWFHDLEPEYYDAPSVPSLFNVGRDLTKARLAYDWPSESVLVLLAEFERSRHMESMQNFEHNSIDIQEFLLRLRGVVRG